MLITSALARFPFGITTSLLSKVNKCVYKISIRCTVPLCPIPIITSPTWKGLNNRIKTPPAKLDREPCKARPIANPAAPKIAKKDDMGTPTIVATPINKETKSSALTNPNKKVLKERLVSLFSKINCKPTSNLLTTNLPTR